MPLDTFVGHVVDSQLLTADELGLLIESVPQERRLQDGEQLARELVRQKRLTAYQAKAIYQGKGKNLILGNYRILDKLGEGGMGMVLKAEHTRMQRLVALKVLSSKVIKEPGALQRFLREVKAAARLSHPNIVTAHDSDEAKGTHFLVMEYVEGQDLASVVRQHGRLPVEKALNCVLQAARGLDYAHRQHVIHRDIKPSNLLLDRDGNVKVLDMGLARLDQEMFEQTDLTESGSMMGTIDYMSPEQATDTKHADARSDIYSLGCTLHFLLTARQVYSGQSVMNKLMAHRDAPIPSLCEQRSEVPEAVEHLFRKMVAKRTEDRQTSMVEVIAELERCASQAASASPFKGASSDDRELEAFLSAAANRPTLPVLKTDPAGGLLLDNPAVAPQVGTTPTVVSKGSALEETQTWQRKGEAPSPRPSPGGRGSDTRWRGPRWILAAAGAALLVVGLALAGIFLRVSTPIGTIVLEVDQPELAGAVVTVDGQQKITIRTTDSPEPIEVKADEQQHTLEVTKGGFQTFTKAFTVKSGKSETIRVWLEKAVPKAESGKDQQMAVGAADQRAATSNDRGTLREPQPPDAAVADSPPTPVAAEITPKSDVLSPPANLLPAAVAEATVTTVPPSTDAKPAVDPATDKTAQSAGAEQEAKLATGPPAPVPAAGPQAASEKARPFPTGSSADLLTSEDWEWTIPENLGSVVNSAYFDATPFLSDDGLSLFFASDRRGGQGKSDLFVSTRSSTKSPWSMPAGLGTVINSSRVERSPLLSRDGLTIFFGVEDDAPKMHLYMATRTSIVRPWTAAARLGAPINTLDMDAISPWVSGDGLQLTFASGRRGGYGAHDLWVSTRRSAAEEWSYPENLGHTVNTPEEDINPCAHQIN